MKRAGERRPQGDHRRRIPPHLFPRRLPGEARRRRDPLRRIRRQVPQGRRQRSRLQAADHACRRQDPPCQAIQGADFDFLKARRRGRRKSASRRRRCCISAAAARRSATRLSDLEEFYDDLTAAYRDEVADLAARGCRYLQLDDTNLAYLCDPEDPRAHARRAATIPMRWRGSIAGSSTTRSATARRT